MFVELNSPLILANAFPVWLIPILVVVGIIVINLIAFMIKRILQHQKYKDVDSDQWIEALGGKDNIISIQAVGSRLSLVVKDKNLFDRQKLGDLGVSSILVMTTKLTLVIEGKATKVAETLNAALKK